MERTSGSITDQNDWFVTQNMMFTYSEEEQEENRIAKNNAALVLRPEYFTIDFQMLHSGFTWYECAIYSFIKFFLKNNNRFYCTNEQLAEMLGIGERSIIAAMSHLQEAWLIRNKYRIKTWWWKIRFVELQKTTIQKSEFCFSEKQIPLDINNKIINNKNKDIDKSISLQREEKEVKKYWEFWHILLVDEQYDKLRREIWWWLKDLIDDCDRWLELNPRKKYKNYYAFVKNRYKNNQKRIQNEIEVKQKLYANKGSKYIKPNNVISKQNQQQKFQQLLDDNKQYNGWDQNQTTNRRTEIGGENLFSE